MSSERPQKLCPTCNNPTTPSSVGHICSNCEKIWPRNHIRATDELAISPAAAAADHVELDNAQTPTPIDLPSARVYKTKLRHRLKRLIVPELPSAVNSASELSPPVLEDILKEDVPKVPSELSSSKPDVKAKSSGPAILGLEAYSLAEDIAEQDPIQTEASLSNKTTPNQRVSTKDQKTSHRARKWLLVVGIFAAVVLAGIAWFAFTHKTPAKAPVAPANSNSNSSTQADKTAATAATARDTQRKKDVTDIATALEVYKQQQGSYPVGDDIKAVYPLQYTTPPYISYINYDPSSTDTLKVKYSYSSDGSSFTLKAKLEDPTDKEAISGYYVVRSK